MTVSSASGTSKSSRTATPVLALDRNAIGSSQPRNGVPQSLTMPNCGLSIICHTKVTATTGATYGSSIDGAHQRAAAERPPQRQRRDQPDADRADRGADRVDAGWSTATTRSRGR